MNQSFHFDELTHVYRIGHRIVPGVTRVLEHSGCVDYSHIREEILELASERGKRVHLARHYFDLNDLDIDTVREDEVGFVMSWEAFRKASGFTPIASEHQQIAEINGHQYGMKLDVMGYFPRMSRFAVIDTKTGPVGWWTAVQTAAYAAGCSEIQEDTVSQSPFARFLARDRFAVRLWPDGRPGTLTQFKDQKDFHAWESALFLAHYKMLHGMKLREEPREEHNDGAINSAGI